MSSAGSDENIDLRELEYEIAQIIDKDNLEEILKLQIAEYEMLESMFPNPGELSLDDYSVLADIHDYLNGRSTVVPPQLDYTITISIEGHKLEVCVNLPVEYPNAEPGIFTRSEDLNRNQQRELNNDLGKYISGLERGDICIFLAVSWLQENALKYFKSKPSKPNMVMSSTEKQSFTRYWIYSHHIYCKFKRREILTLASEYNQTGFCLPGRPGIICFEGASADCEEYWQKVKNMNWKKIMCKTIEEVKLDSEPVDKFRKFPDFRELSFGSGSNQKHSDFGEFYKYLSHYHCEYIFKDYFGMDGK